MTLRGGTPYDRPSISALEPSDRQRMSNIVVSSFLLIMFSFWWPVDTKTALGMILAGLGCMLGWRYGLGLSDSVYEVIRGMAGGFFSTY